MDVVDDWGRKTCVSSSEESFTPFFLNPSASELLFASPSLSPPILPTVTRLTPSRFLTVSGVPPSVSSAIESSFSIPNPNEDAARVLSYNRLQFLPCPRRNSVVLFFPTGTNLDQLGFLVLSTGDSGGFRVMGPDQGDVFTATERFFSRILKILVQPISDLGAYNCSSSSSSELGYVMVYSLYSIHWYCVKYDEYLGRPVLTYLGSKKFKLCLIASASWSPHLPGECLALLENGDIFTFDLNQRHCRFRGCKLKVTWEGQGKSANCSWLGCEFGLRIGSFIVARSDAVFVVTRSSGCCCTARSLMETESLNMNRTEKLVAFARAGGDDSFRFLLASKSYVFLCDERSGVPLLKWQHDVDKPCFLDSYTLPDLGFESDESATTSCVIIGSFWNAQSQMFWYGPSKDPSSLCVWELPHNILSPAGKCLCGDCVINEMITKESLPVWIDWQKKRVLVLGFGVLNKYIPLHDQSSGFTLIRLTSSGKLEAVKFHASSKAPEVISHIDSASKSDEVNLLYFPDDEKYKFPKRFRYLELEYLTAHTKGILAGLLDSKMSKKSSDFKNSSLFSSTCHEELCEKLEICGFGSDRCSSTITAAFDSVSSPTSLFDVALRETWSSLPTELSSLAFSTYSEFEDVRLDKKETSLEFLPVPEFPQLPPFSLRKPSRRSSKWSKKDQPGADLVGPVLPLPVLLTLHEFSNGCLDSEQEFSPDVEFDERCKQISKAAREIANSGVDDTTISLDGDEDMWLNNDSQKEKKKRFIAYSPMTKTSNSDGRHQDLATTYIAKVRRCEDNDGSVLGEVRAGFEVFDDMCPVEMCFEDRNATFDTKELLTSMTVLSQWQKQSSSYNGFLSQYHLN